MAAWLLLAGCVAPPVCRAGWSADETGHCWPTEAISFEAGLDDLTPCDTPTGDGRIDVEGGCVEGACAYGPVEPFDDAFGDERTCFGASFSYDWVYCQWPQGVEGLFPDYDHDGGPDPGAAGDRIHLYPPYDGTSDRGLGVGVRNSCFLDVYGTPELVVLTAVDGILEPDELYWPDQGLHVYDWGDDDGTGHANDRPDNLYLYGP